QRRLRILGQGQLVGGPFPHDGGKLVAQRRIDLLEHRPRRPIGLRERLSHADRLAPLPRKHECDRHSPTPKTAAAVRHRPFSPVKLESRSVPGTDWKPWLLTARQAWLHRIPHYAFSLKADIGDKRSPRSIERA